MDLYTVRNELACGRTVFELPLRVTYYARVSTDSMEQLHSLQAQSEYYDSCIRENPCWELVPGYIDEGISGTAVKKRDSFLRMIADGKGEKFDLILTKEVSRFARNTLDSIKYTQELLSHGVGVFFQADNINTLLPDAELRLTIMASVAQDEVRKTSERVRFGFKRAIEKGVVLGSDRIWGYRKDNGRLVVVEEEAELVRKIFRLYAMEGMGMRAIAERLNEEGLTNSNGRPFGFSTISGILANPKYKGYYCGNKTRKVDYKLDKVKTLPQKEWVLYPAPDRVPAIVAPELWDKASALRHSRNARFGSSNTGNRYPFSGRIFCGEHNKPYYRAVYRYPSGNKEVWQCSIYARQGKAGCAMPVLYGSELQQIAAYVIKSFLPHSQELAEELLEIYAQTVAKGSNESRCKNLQKAMEQNTRRKDKLLDLNIDGRITDEEFSRRNTELEQRHAGLYQEWLLLQQQKEEPFAADAIRPTIANLMKFDHSLTAPLISAFIEKIVVEKEDAGKYLLQIYAPENKMPSMTCGLQLSPRKLLFPH